MRNLKEYTALLVKSIKLLSWPVGSIYTSTKSTDPHELFGGTWEALPAGYTLIMQGSGADDAGSYTYTAGQKYGERLHQLTVEELPPFSAKVATAAYQTDYVSPGGRWSAYAVEVTNNTTFASQYIWAQSVGTQNQAHNNIPPSIAVYGWIRTA